MRSDEEALPREYTLHGGEEIHAIWKMDEPHRGTGRALELGNGGIRSVVSGDMSRPLAEFAFEKSLLSFAEARPTR